MMGIATPSEEQVNAWAGFIQRVGLVGVLLGAVLAFVFWVGNQQMNMYQKREEERDRTIEVTISGLREHIAERGKTIETLLTGVVTENTRAMSQVANSLDGFQEETSNLSEEVKQLGEEIKALNSPKNN